MRPQIMRLAAAARLPVLAVALVLAACANQPLVADKFPPVSFADQKPYVFNVARVEIVSKYTSSSQPPHIEFDMPVSPENALKRWVEDRIKPAGTTGTLRVVINDASATETPLPRDTSASQLFTTQQTSRIDMSANIALQILDERQFVKAEVTGQASRSRTLPEGIKLNERDKILYDMVIALVRDVGTEVDPQIQATFPTYMTQ